MSYYPIDNHFHRAHFKTSKCPFFAATAHVYSSHGQYFHEPILKTSKCPFYAASAQISVSHGHFFCNRTHFKINNKPFLATSLHFII